MDNLMGPEKEYTHRSSSFYEREYKRLKAIDDQLKFELYEAEKKIESLELDISAAYYCAYDAEDDERNDCNSCRCNSCISMKLKFLEKEIKSKDEIINKILTDKLEEGDLPYQYLETIRLNYQKDLEETKEKLRKTNAFNLKRASDAINNNSLLEADIRRLEKTLKLIAEENMRLRFPVKECLENGIMPFTPKPPLGPRRVEGTKYVGSVINARGKQYVAHPNHPLRELMPDGSLEVVEFLSFKDKKELRDFNVESVYKAVMSRLGENE